MQRSIIIFLVLMATFGSVYAIKRYAIPGNAHSLPASTPQHTYHRIISAAPSSTEMLFALGLGDSVVGVTSFCTYPPEAKSKTSIGALVDTNYEAIVTLHPDLVVLLPSLKEQKKQLDALHVPTIVLSSTNLEGVIESLLQLGQICGVEEEAHDLVAEMRSRVERVQKKVAGLPRPRVLLSTGRDMGAPGIEQVFVAGKGDFLDDFITLAGGENAFTDESIMYPSMSAEGILALNPDIIIELRSDAVKAQEEHDSVLSAWRQLNALNAVRDNRIYIASGDYIMIPGPRMVQTLEDLAQCIHPEADWKTP